MSYLMLFYILILLLTGCTSSTNNSKREQNSNKYAHRFQIEKINNITKLTVFNPWEKAKNVSVEYFLINKKDRVPEDKTNMKRIIRIPVERVICLSTTHIAFLEALNETGTVVGISGSRYVSNPRIRERIGRGEVPDIGYGQNLNYELIVNLKPDLVMIYGVSSEVAGYVQKLEELGIPVVMVAEYLEETPLGKAEWVKFVGSFFEKEDTGSEYFKEVQDEYTRLKKLAGGKKIKPQVLVGSAYKDNWWVPGGRSYMANLILDAGGYYLGKENSSHDSYVISFENALLWGSKADIWINMGNMASKREILDSDVRFKNFKVFKNGKIYNNIKRLSTQGGNDFWESGTVNPHIVLRDLIMVFHPGLIDGEFYFYKEIK